MNDKRQMQNATGLFSFLFDTLVSCTMRNKLKRRKHCEDTACLNIDRVTAAEAITVVSESSSSEDEEPPAGVSLSDAASAAASSANQVQPVQEETKRRCATHIKIAPIFLCTAQRSERKRSSRGELCQPVDQHKSVLLPSHGDDSPRSRGQQLLPTSAVSPLIEEEGPVMGTRRGQLSPSSLYTCLEEIKTCSPTFPVQTVFSTLQSKASYRLQDLESTAEYYQYPSSLQDYMSKKRKRGNDLSESLSKRLKVSLTAERVVGMDHCHTPAQNVLPVKKQPRSSKLSRTHRLRQQSENSAGLVSNCEVKSDTDRTASDSQSSIMCNILHRVSSVEDVLWTDKYSPQCSSEVIGNSHSVNKLYSWLKKWKLRSDSDKRRKMEEKKQEENCSDSWDCGDFQGEAGADDDREEMLCNTMLITGPPGVGKTASVYACAKELGFKVFEVNCSSQRSGCHVLSQLKEATQSHLVEMSGNDPHKPAYFKNYTTNNPTPKSEALLGKTAHPKNVISTTKKRAAQNSGRKRKANPATVTLANYFKMKVKADCLHFGGLSTSEKPDTKTLGNPSPSSDQTEPHSKKTATSLILFEEVDVIFDDDVGFLAAIKAFMTTTKRPVILTTNDPSFKTRFFCSLEEIIFKTPSAVSLRSYLQLVGLAENIKVEFNDVSSLLRLTQGDVRRCLLQLQLWVHSGGGRASQSGGLIKESTCEEYLNVTRGGGSLDLQLPPCETGCSASMLGLTHVTQIQLLNHLKSQYWCETDINKFLMPLAESWGRCVPLLYSNLELLLPLGAKGTSVHCLHTVTSLGLHNKLASSDTELHIQLNGNVSAKASAINCKYVRNMSRLSRRKCNTMFDTTSTSSLTQRTLFSLNGPPSAAPGSSDKTEQKADKVETNSLIALAEFFDAMSYIDATLLAAAPLISGPCRPDAFAWTGAEIKDGLLDEMSMEERGSWSQERLLNIQAAVEGLGFHMCCWQLSESWTGAQKYKQEKEDKNGGRLVERLMLPAASKRHNISFTVQPLCAPSLSQRRYELSRTVFGSKYFNLLGNRQAVSVDYMPILRSICRFQRAQQQKEEPLRYLNYFNNTHLGLSKSTMKLLAEDFS